jgi:hypothetical protein
VRTLIPIIFLALLALVGEAKAHQSSLSYGSLERSEDGTRLDYEIRLSTKDLFEALELEEDRDATDEEIEAGSEKLRSYVFQRVHLSAEGCQFEPGPTRVVKQGERFAQVTGALVCGQPIAKAALDYQLFFDLDARHEGLLRVDGKLVQLKQDTRHYQYGGAASSVWGFLPSGFEHVVYGFDHILFLLALLLVVCLTREEGTIVLRAPMSSLRHTAGIVTAFTVAHSITLIAAALGWIELSSRFVESVIAASIIYVAIENVLRPVPRARYLVTFAFGLIHGLGFAAMLRPLLPPDATVLPLLVFNLGVELGQLAVVGVSLPLLFLLLRAMSVATYRRMVLPLAALGLSAVALVWFVERAFGWSLL